MDLKDLLELQLHTLAVLAAGYLGYRIASLGRDAAHGPVDVLFQSLVFGLVARTIVGLLATDANKSEIWVIAVALAAAILGAGLWRKWLSRAYQATMRGLGLSFSDRHKTVWLTMLAENDHLKGPTELMVRLKDQTMLRSAPLHQFAKAPHGPCILGDDGSIGMYVTAVKLAGDDEFDHTPPFYEEAKDWGYAMRFIPASEIAWVEVRRPV